mmetsp:Transcript_144995/g.403874  ORF Transcript_144995/g.403874 Transcript_144995/m.403874 type:complete len:214 (+) Transcript_144995:368-1009(+)
MEPVLPHSLCWERRPPRQGRRLRRHWIGLSWPAQAHGRFRVGSRALPLPPRHSGAHHSLAQCSKARHSRVQPRVRCRPSAPRPGPRPCRGSPGLMSCRCRAQPLRLVPRLRRRARILPAAAPVRRGLAWAQGSWWAQWAMAAARCRTCSSRWQLWAWRPTRWRPLLVRCMLQLSRQPRCRWEQCGPELWEGSAWLTLGFPCTGWQLESRISQH